MQSSNHISVLSKEVGEALAIRSGEWFVDATLGAGGHTRTILEAGGKVIAFDFDLEAIKNAESNFEEELRQQKLILVRENFTELEVVLAQLKSKQEIKNISGVVFDFGTSSDQLMDGERGFSFAGSGVLDMRMDTRLGVTAADLLSAVPEKQLAQLFFEYGGETSAKKIAKAIKAAPKKITTADQLTKVVLSVKGAQKSPLHPATKVFQALRIAVNTELDNIRQALPQAFSAVVQGGRLVTISFHEGEDEIVKTQFSLWEKAKKATVSKKPLSPTQAELTHNPRSRSARMRVATKL